MAIVGLLAFVVTIGLSGCSTVEGMGKDIQKGGEAIEKAAK
ncbi:MAG TPA: entericidin A/B family lipoprotein [Sedimenticola thiotaurini]|uniref:Entericidin A/B family lipoprotein n=1 Tax=Sedimenticola thiotaurini TaxID=1543721 RepID=A0A831W9N3_9GAMM|nr:entericidin A/B family lipoprotein [Sedimenticola thiotaurini]